MFIERGHGLSRRPKRGAHLGSTRVRPSPPEKNMGVKGVGERRGKTGKNVQGDCPAFSFEMLQYDVEEESRVLQL